MSIWSGIAAAGVAIALAFAAVANPIWEWRTEDSQHTEVWSFSTFSARHTIYNNYSQRIDFLRDYPYDQLVSIQPDMAKALAEYSQFFILGLAAGFAGLGLSLLSVWKKLRGLYAGIAFLAACASSLYASFAIVFTIPPAAKTNLRIPVPQFLGQYAGGSFNTTWMPLADGFSSSAQAWPSHGRRRTSGTSCRGGSWLQRRWK